MHTTVTKDPAVLALYLNERRLGRIANLRLMPEQLLRKRTLTIGFVELEKEVGVLAIQQPDNLE